jgi:putative ABC transport system permease protein
MLQYLIESATMTLVGGLIGVIAGVAFAKAITLIIGFPSEIELWSVALGLFVATVVGIFFGVYPARKASLLRSHRGFALGAVRRWRNEARGHQ